MMIHFIAKSFRRLKIFFYFNGGWKFEVRVYMKKKKKQDLRKSKKKKDYAIDLNHL